MFSVDKEEAKRILQEDRFHNGFNPAKWTMTFPWNGVNYTV